MREKVGNIYPDIYTYEKYIVIYSNYLDISWYSTMISSTKISPGHLVATTFWMVEKIKGVGLQGRPTPNTHYITLHYTPQHYNYNYTTTLHSTTLYYTKLHSTTLHYTTLHYITLHYTTTTTTQLH